MPATALRRRDIVRFRWARHQLDGASPAGDVALLDYGVQDTGPDGALWALLLRGAPAPAPGDLAWAWTLRGAPHAYRRSDLAAIAVATAPYSERDASKRIFDAAKPLKAAGIPTLTALRVVASHLRDLASRPIVKGDLSGRLTERVDPPYLRYCRACQATHVYEMPFRLAALPAGLELDAGTSPPVLRRITRLRAPKYQHLAGEAEPRFDVIRNYLRFYGPARVRDVAGFVDAPAAEIKAHWPADAVEVAVAGVAVAGRPETWFALAADIGALTGTGPEGSTGTVALLGPYDPYLQLRDRELLVDDEARRKDLWRVLGRPGAIVADGEIVGTWRPRTAGAKVTVRIELWGRFAAKRRTLVTEQAERLAAHRGVALAKVVET